MKRFYTSEAVTAGHLDKLCDQAPDIKSAVDRKVFQPSEGQKKMLRAAPEHLFLFPSPGEKHGHLFRVLFPTLVLGHVLFQQRG